MMAEEDGERGRSLAASPPPPPPPSRRPLLMSVPSATFYNHVADYLDEGDVCRLMQVGGNNNEFGRRFFRLVEHFCPIHGRRLKTAVVTSLQAATTTTTTKERLCPTCQMQELKERIRRCDRCENFCEVDELETCDICGETCCCFDSCCGLYSIPDNNDDDDEGDDYCCERDCERMVCRNCRKRGPCGSRHHNTNDGDAEVFCSQHSNGEVLGGSWRCENCGAELCRSCRKLHLEEAREKLVLAAHGVSYSSLTTPPVFQCAHCKEIKCLVCHGCSHVCRSKIDGDICNHCNSRYYHLGSYDGPDHEFELIANLDGSIRKVY